MKKRMLSEITINWINLIPKIVNGNGCWIPVNWKASNDGYISITINYKEYLLHRLVLSTYNNLNYEDSSWDTRHSTKCDRACFNPEHLKSGTPGDNIRDSIKDKTHRNSRKKNCPRCSSEYTTEIVKTGWNKGKIVRRCHNCNTLRNRGLLNK